MFKRKSINSGTFICVPLKLQKIPGVVNTCRCITRFYKTFFFLPHRLHPCCQKETISQHIPAVFRLFSLMMCTIVLPWRGSLAPSSSSCPRHPPQRPLHNFVRRCQQSCVMTDSISRRGRQNLCTLSPPPSHLTEINQLTVLHYGPAWCCSP